MQLDSPGLTLLNRILRDATLAEGTVNHTNPSKPYEEGITLAEWVASYDYLIGKGEITRKWFDRSLTRCSSEGGCNLTTIGGILCLLGIARYAQRGVCRKV
jgi:hypothetical protein